MIFLKFKAQLAIILSNKASTCIILQFLSINIKKFNICNTHMNCFDWVLWKIDVYFHWRQGNVTGRKHNIHFFNKTNTNHFENIA